jgi:hypothetical protein
MQPVYPEIIRRGFIAWASKYGNILAINRHQDAPEPKRPYIDIHNDSTEREMDDLESLPDETGTRYIRGTHGFRLSIRYFGGPDATGSLDKLVSTFRRSDVRSFLRNYYIIVISVGVVQDMTFLEQMHNVERADVELRCRTSINVPYGGDGDSDNSVIESVGIDGTFEPINETVEIAIP